MSEATEPSHIYHAEAIALGGSLRLPLPHQIEPQAHTQLAAKGGYFSQRSEGYRLESVLSFRSAYSHVSEQPQLQAARGMATLTTTVVEGPQYPRGPHRRPRRGPDHH